MKNLFLIVIVAFLPAMGFGQKAAKDSVKNTNRPVLISDTTITIASDSLKNMLGANGKNKFMPVPKTATRLALIPGGGQIYNRDYWKLPIVYLSIGGGIYAFRQNNIRYHDFLTAYKTFYILNVAKTDPTYGTLKKGMPTTNVIVRESIFNNSGVLQEASRDQIERQKNYWRRNRSLSIIVAGLIYTLSLIEANVAAHLKTFDLSDDISLKVEPKISQPMFNQPAPGLRLVFNFK